MYICTECPDSPEQRAGQCTQYRYTYALSVDVNSDGTVDYKRTGFFHAKVCEGIGLGFGVEQGPIVNYRPVGARATNKWILKNTNHDSVYESLYDENKIDRIIELTHCSFGSEISAPRDEDEGYHDIEMAPAFRSWDESPNLILNDFSGFGVLGGAHGASKVTLSGRMKLTGTHHRNNEDDGVILAVTADYNVSNDSYCWDTIDQFDNDHYALAIKWSPYADSGNGILKVKDSSGVHKYAEITSGSGEAHPTIVWPHPTIVWQLDIILPDNWVKGLSQIEQQNAGIDHEYKYQLYADVNLDGIFDVIHHGTLTMAH